MGCQSKVTLGKNLTFTVNTHTLAGAAADADSVPTYRVYEDETGTPILTGSMAKLDDANTTGFYSEQIACTSANGFEDGKSYTVRIQALMSTVPGVETYSFLVEAPDLGAGARAITITVTDGTDPLENALVRLKASNNVFQGYTDASGVATFSLDDATYTVTITKAGYSFTPTTLAVTTDTSQSYAMTGFTLTASNPGFITGYLYCYDHEGVVEQYVDVEMVFYLKSDVDAVAYDQKIRTETSDATGLVEFTNLFPGATYMLRRGDRQLFSAITGSYYTKAVQREDWLKVEIPLTATTPYELPALWGVDDET